MLTLSERFFSVTLHDSISSSLIGVTPRLVVLRRRKRPMRKNASVLRTKATDPRTTERTMTRVCLDRAASLIMGVPGSFGGMDGKRDDDGSDLNEVMLDDEGMKEIPSEDGMGVVKSEGIGIVTEDLDGTMGVDNIGIDVMSIGVAVVSRTGCAVKIGVLVVIDV